jgi:HTH-type transcriptional regulator, glycine betaine synthesis regulator
VKPDAVNTIADEAILRVADTVGGLMEFWGFKRNMGRMWCVLYLEHRPLSAAELVQRLSLSTGAVSMTTTELSHWGVIKRAWVPGERRDYWEAETSIWKMISRVFRERELRKIQEAIETFQAAIATLDARRAEAEAAEGPRLDVALGRIRSLLTLAEIGNRLLTAVLDGKAIDTGPLAGFRDPS